MDRRNFDSTSKKVIDRSLVNDEIYPLPKDKQKILDISRVILSDNIINPTLNSFSDTQLRGKNPIEIFTEEELEKEFNFWFEDVDISSITVKKLINTKNLQLVELYLLAMYKDTSPDVLDFIGNSVVTPSIKNSFSNIFYLLPLYSLVARNKNTSAGTLTYFYQFFKNIFRYVYDNDIPINSAIYSTLVCSFNLIFDIALNENTPRYILEDIYKFSLLKNFNIIDFMIIIYNNKNIKIKDYNINYGDFCIIIEYTFFSKGFLDDIVENLLKNENLSYSLLEKIYKEMLNKISSTKIHYLSNQSKFDKYEMFINMIKNHPKFTMEAYVKDFVEC